MKHNLVSLQCDFSGFNIGPEKLLPRLGLVSALLLHPPPNMSWANTVFPCLSLALCYANMFALFAMFKAAFGSRQIK